MTRETKIGLLVGLAFIIVIGILLSDHINSTSDPVRADVTETFKSVEAGVNSPESRPPAGKDVAVTPQRVVPQNPVPVVPESQQRPNTGQIIVELTPGSDPASQLPNRTPPQNPNPQADPITNPSIPSGPENNQVANNEQANPPGNDGRIPQALQEAARKNQEQLVIPGTSGPVGISQGPHVNPQPAPPAAANFRAVKAEEGDTVSKLASKYMGGNTKANREAIIKANPTVGQDGSKVFAGRTYQIPAVDSSANQKPQTQEPPVSIAPTKPIAQDTPTPTTPGVTWYTVKENDNLWKIAAEQLGSGARWSEIKELNGLKSDDVRVNMRLKMPSKQ